MKKILSVSRFEIKGVKVTFAAGFKGRNPVVVFGMKSPKNGSAIDFVALETPYPCIQDAIQFVEQSTEETAKLFMSRFTSDTGYLSIVNTFNDPDFIPLKDYQLKPQ